MSKVNPNAVLALAPEITEATKDALTSAVADIEQIFTADENTDVTMTLMDHLQVPSFDKRLAAKYVAIDAHLDANTATLNTAISEANTTIASTVSTAKSDISTTIATANDEIQATILEAESQVSTLVQTTTATVNSLDTQIQTTIQTQTGLVTTAINQAEQDVNTLVNSTNSHVSDTLDSATTQVSELITTTSSSVNSLIDRADTTHTQYAQVYLSEGEVSVELPNGEFTDNLNKRVKDAVSIATSNKLDANANAVSASKLQTPIEIQGVLFDGSTSIELPVFTDTEDGLVPASTNESYYLKGDGTWANPLEDLSSLIDDMDNLALVDDQGILLESQFPSNLDVVAASADKLTTPVNIHGVSFDGSYPIDIPEFSEDTSGVVPKRVGTTNIKYLREDGVWEVPVNTTYTALSIALAEAGVDANAHLISADVLKQAIQKHAPTPTDITGNAGTADKLKNKVTINDVEFDGSSNIVIQTGSSAFIGSITWFNGNYMKMPDGYQRAHGQEYNRADYPELWLAIATEQFVSVTDTEWLADPTKRGNYSTGNGTTTFRMPDLNGAQAGSIKAPVLRGNGDGTVAGESKSIGQMDTDAIREIEGSTSWMSYESDAGGKINGVGGVGGAFYSGTQISNTLTGAAWKGISGDQYRPLNFRASRVVPTAPENRMNSAYGIWIIKVRPDTATVNPMPPATLMHNEYNGNQIVNGDVIIRGNIVIKDTAGVRVDLPLGFIEWFNGRRTAIRLGTLPADGLLLNRTDYPALWAEVENGGFESVSEIEWQSTPSKRGCYSTGDGTTTFRLPDLNGFQTGSIKAPVLRGDGGGLVAGEVKTIGQMDTDAIREITAKLPIEGSAVSGAIALTGNTVTGAGGGAGTDQEGEFKASRVVPTAPENRMNSVYGIWIIRVNGGIPNTSAGTGATLESNIFNGSQRIQGDVEVEGTFTANIKPLLNATGSAPIGALRAFAAFGYVGGILSIYSNLNITSVVRNSTGDYTLNFTTPLPNANYGVVFGGGSNGSEDIARQLCVAYSNDSGTPLLKTTTQLRIIRGLTSSTGVKDGAFITVGIL